MNYSQLSQAIQDYCQSTETSFVSNISTFVKQAEQRIYNTIQFPSLRKNVTGTVTSGNKYLACPDDFLSVYSLAVIKNDGSYEDQNLHLNTRLGVGENKLMIASTKKAQSI